MLKVSLRATQYFSFNILFITHFKLIFIIIYPPNINYEHNKSKHSESSTKK